MNSQKCIWPDILTRVHSAVTRSPGLSRVVFTVHVIDETLSVEHAKCQHSGVKSGIRILLTVE